MPSRQQVEKAAKAIKFMIDLSCIPPRTPTGYWTAKGLREVKWPRDFSIQERRQIRAIARAALNGDDEQAGSKS